MSNDQRCGYRCPFGVCHPSVPFSCGFEIKFLLAFIKGQRTRLLRRLPCGHCPRPSAQIAAGGLRDVTRIPFRKRCLGGSSTLSLPSANIRPHRVPRQKNFWCERSSWWCKTSQPFVLSWAGSPNAARTGFLLAPPHPEARRWRPRRS